MNLASECWLVDGCWLVGCDVVVFIKLMYELVYTLVELKPGIINQQQPALNKPLLVGAWGDSGSRGAVAEGNGI